MFEKLLSRFNFKPFYLGAGQTIITHQVRNTERKMADKREWALRDRVAGHGLLEEVGEGLGLAVWEEFG